MQKRKSKEEERMNKVQYPTLIWSKKNSWISLFNTLKVLDTKERSRARKVDMEKKKTTQSAALDELKKKREEKAAKTEEQQRKEELEGKKKWKANDIYSSDSDDSDIDKKGNTGLWLVDTDHVTWILASDWLMFITWPEYWLVIGW